MGNSASSLPFDLGDQKAYDLEYWSLHDGTRKEKTAPGDDVEERISAVSVFRYDKKQADLSQLPMAQRAFQKLRTIKHPYILAFLDGIEEESAVLMATEPVVPLSSWLKQPRPDAISEETRKDIKDQLVWGTKCILEATQFLHRQCGLLHGFLGPQAIFVSKNGDWKLGALDLACALTDPEDQAFFAKFDHKLDRRYRSQEREDGSWRSLLSTKAYLSMDSYSLGAVLAMAFSTLHVSPPEQLQNYLTKAGVSEPRRRPSPQQLLRCGAFSSEYGRMMDCIAELPLKAFGEIVNTIEELTSMRPLMSRAVCSFKILPAVSAALESCFSTFSRRDAREQCRRIAQATIDLVGALADEEKLDASEFNGRFVAIYNKLWTLTDRAIRTTLLRSLRPFAPLLTRETTNSCIFDHLITGFSDSNAKMREETLKCLVHVLGQLENSTLNDRLVRCISNLSQDGEVSIRTNAVIFMGRMAEKLQPTVRTRMVCTAFPKAMNDGFVFCRLAGLRSALACSGLVEFGPLATKVLPVAVALTVDRSGDVRELALRFLDAFSKRARMEHERLSAEDTLKKAEAHTNGENKKSLAPPTATSAGAAQTEPDGGKGWGAWALDSLTKTIENSVQGDEAPDAARIGELKGITRSSSSSSSSSSSGSCSSSSSSSSSSHSSNDSRSGSNKISSDMGNSYNMGDGKVAHTSAGSTNTRDAAAGWDDEELYFDSDTSEKESPPKRGMQLQKASPRSADAWDDDFDIDEDTEQPVPSPAPPAKLVDKKVVGRLGAASRSGSTSGNVKQGDLDTNGTKIMRGVGSVTTAKSPNGAPSGGGGNIASTAKTGGSLGMKLAPPSRPRTASAASSLKIGGLQKKEPKPVIKKLTTKVDDFEFDDF